MPDQTNTYAPRIFALIFSHFAIISPSVMFFFSRGSSINLLTSDVMVDVHVLIDSRNLDHPSLFQNPYGKCD